MSDLENKICDAHADSSEQTVGGSSSESEYILVEGVAMADRGASSQKNAPATRICLNLSVIGLIVSVFAGLGIFFSLAGLILGCVRRKDDALVSRYAIVMGIIGIVLSVIFAALEVYAIAVALAGL